VYTVIRELRSERLLGLRIVGGLSEKENAALGRLVEQQAAKVGKIRLLLLLEKYAPIDRAESLLEDLRFVKLAADRIDRMAVVGERTWQETWIALFGLFGGVETAYFTHADRQAAAEWITSP
jgi:hypothetical protein